MRDPAWWGRPSRAGACLGAALLLGILGCGDANHSGAQPIEPLEPPTPPQAMGTGTELVGSMPQEPAPEGVVGLAPGTVARLVAEQTPKPEPSPESLPEEAGHGSERPASPSPTPESGSEQPTPPATPARAAAKPGPSAQPATNDSPAPATTTPSEVTSIGPATKLPPMRVATATVATAIVDRQPQGAADHFAEGTKVHCFTAIINEGGGHRKIRHRWMHDGELKAQVKLNVKATRWRTWSAIPVYGHGKWQIDVVDEAGTVLKSVAFRVE